MGHTSAPISIPPRLHRLSVDSQSGLCGSELQARRVRETVQANDSSLIADIVEQHTRLLAQQLLKRLVRSLDDSLAADIEVAALQYSPTDSSVRLLRRIWYRGRTYFYE